MEQQHERNIEMIAKYPNKKKTTLRGLFITGLFITGAIVTCLLLFLSFTIGKAVGSHQLSSLINQGFGSIKSTTQPLEISKDTDFEPFWKAWVLLEKYYVGGASVASSTDQVPTTDQDKVWGAISGLTASYGDPFTSFLPPESKEMFDSDIKGEFSGVGMEIGNRNSFLTVISPLPGTPAAQSGLQPQDVVSKIDGVDSLRMPVEQAVKLIRGPKGEAVVLTVLREGAGEELEFTVVRDTINIPTISTEKIDDVFVIKLYSFTAKSSPLFAEALQEFVNSKKKKLLIDFRNNPGGYLESAVQIASWFLDEGETVVTEQYGDSKDDKIHQALSNRLSGKDLRVAVLVNEGSASASEIVAGALRDHNKALVLGRTTFGKGSVQELFNLTPETYLKITIAKWLTPNGKHISENGITPDIIFDKDTGNNKHDQGSYNPNLSQDPDIINAIKVLNKPQYQELFSEIPEGYKEQFLNKSEE